MLFQLKGNEILQYIKRVEQKFSVSRFFDFSKALIFVIGNLNEALEMSGEVSKDHDPDLLHEESKKITLSKTKEALKERFRMEEIARLGNIHLIYPTFNSQFYREFINKELTEIGNRFNKAFGCKITFTEEVMEMLFKEGVTASQGFRPLGSSIRFWIESSLANLLQSADIAKGVELFSSVR